MPLVRHIGTELGVRSQPPPLHAVRLPTSSRPYVQDQDGYEYLQSTYSP